MSFIEQALHMDILSLIECYPPFHLCPSFIYSIICSGIFGSISYLIFFLSPPLSLFFFYFCMVMLHASASACSSHLEAAQRKSMSCQCHAASAFHWYLSNSSMGLMSCGKMSHMRTYYVYVNEGAFLC